MTTVQEPPNGHSSPSFFKSVISRLKPQHDSDALANEPSDKLKPDRCQFTFSDGRQCRMQSAQLCTHHASKQEPDPGAKGAPDHALEVPELEELCGDLTTATNINRALAQTFLLLAQGRISRRDAVAFGYLSQLLLQTLPAIRREFIDAFGSSVYDAKLRSKLDPRPVEKPSTPNLAEQQLPQRAIEVRHFDSGPAAASGLDSRPAASPARPNNLPQSTAAANASTPPRPPAATSAPLTNPPQPPVPRCKPSPEGPIRKPEPQTSPLSPDRPPRKGYPQDALFAANKVPPPAGNQAAPSPGTAVPSPAPDPAAAVPGIT
jgi:hypothetical protein